MSGSKIVASQDPRDRERVLWVNVVLQAIRDATEAKNSRNADQTRAEARAWFKLSNPDFIESCHCAHLDPDATYEKAMQAIARYDAMKSSSKRPGVSSNLQAFEGTGAGRTAQEIPEITFSEKAQTL